MSAVPPSTTKAFRTPGIVLSAARFADVTLPPKTGHFSKTAYFIPGTVTSMPNSGLPVTLPALSTPLTRVPMMRKSFGSLSATVLRSGGVSAAAAETNSP